MKYLSYIIPLLTACIFMAIILFFSLKCNPEPKNTNLKNLEQKEKELLKSKDERQVVIERKTDTLKAEKIKLVKKNEEIKTEQEKVMSKSDSAAAAFLIEWTSKEVITD